MKIIELLNAIRIPITNEEAEVLSEFDQKESILKEKLTTREQLLANNLVKKDILTRKHNAEGELTYIKKIR
jgi:hypothetical protein